MQPIAVAKRYARALADSAADKDPKRLEAVAAELSLAAKVLGADPKFAHVFADPSISREDKRAAIDALARKARLSEVMRGFLLVLAANRRLGALAAIRDAFEEIADERLGIVKAETTTAVPMSAAESKRLRESLERMTGRTVRITQRVDPSVLGGARTRIGSRVYDGTLRHQLAALRERLVGTR